LHPLRFYCFYARAQNNPAGLELAKARPYADNHISGGWASVPARPADDFERVNPNG